MVTSLSIIGRRVRKSSMIPQAADGRAPAAGRRGPGACRMWASFRVQIAMALVLVALLAALFVAAGWVLVAALVRRLKRRPAPRRLRWARRTVLVLAAAAALCIAYAIFVEPYWLEV